MIRKLLKNALLLALAVAAVIFLHGHIKREAENAAANVNADQETESVTPVGQEVQSMAVLRMGEGVILGRIEEIESGGIRVIVPGEDGAEETHTFTDVAADSWYAGAVNFAVSAGLMTGVGGTDVFQPEFGILRESFASVLYRFTNGQPEEPSKELTDVSPERWYYDAVNWVVNEELMTPLEPGCFGVGKYMTCEQALICLYRVAGKPETDGSLTDYPYAAKVSEAGRSAVDWAWKSGLITEVECVWYPTQAISRAQVALLLMRYSAMS